MKTAQTIITLRQAEALLAFFGGHDSEVAIAPHENGLIAWGVDYPEEGSAWLGETEVDDELAHKGRDAVTRQAEPSTLEASARRIAAQAGEDGDRFIEWLTRDGGLVEMCLSHFRARQQQTAQDVDIVRQVIHTIKSLARFKSPLDLPADSHIEIVAREIVALLATQQQAAPKEASHD